MAARAAKSVEVDLRDPLRIWVAWHPFCEDGEFLAREIFCWFRGDPEDLELCATGIPVYFRCWGRETSELASPAPISFQDALLNVVVFLIDEHFLISKEWRHLVHRYTGRAMSRRIGGTIVLPVALHAGAFQLTGQVQSLNFLRADGVDVPSGESQEARRKRRSRRILNQLTDALGRLLVAKNEGFRIRQFAAPPSKISVFLSHAKQDATDVATRLRDEIQRRGQLETFFDESDLALGYDFRQGLDRALKVGNAVLLAILSDAYSSRPWCRRELREARRPQVIEEPGKQSAGVLKLTPVFVVDNLRVRSADHVPEIGPSPVLRWNEDDVEPMLDALLLHVLRYAYDLQRAKEIAKSRATQPNTWVLNGPPDLRTIAVIQSMARKTIEKGAKLHVVFPGPGVTEDTLADWVDLFPGVAFQRFDDVELEA